MATTRVATFADLLSILTDTNTPHRANVERQVVELPAASPFGTLAVRCDPRLPYAQIIQPMISNIPPERRAEVEHAICLVNNSIALPGFGYEYTRNLLYMRLCVPLYDEGMPWQSFKKQIASVVSNARQFTGAFQRIVDGEPGDRVLTLALSEARS